jgi:hypothetical protein
LHTLYDGAGKTPFIHALDTSTRSARCIDLDALVGTTLSSLRLHLNEAGGTLTVRNGKQSLLVVDTRTFRTSKPSSSTFSSPTSRTLASVAFSVGALAAAAALWITLRRRRRRRLAVAH